MCTKGAISSYRFVLGAVLLLAAAPAVSAEIADGAILRRWVDPRIEQTPVCLALKRAADRLPRSTSVYHWTEQIHLKGLSRPDWKPVDYMAHADLVRSVVLQTQRWYHETDEQAWARESAWFNAQVREGRSVMDAVTVDFGADAGRVELYRILCEVEDWTLDGAPVRVDENRFRTTTSWIFVVKSSSYSSVVRDHMFSEATAGITADLIFINNAAFFIEMPHGTIAKLFIPDFRVVPEKEQMDQVVLDPLCALGVDRSSN
jgi:hypothetical protein